MRLDLLLCRIGIHRWLHVMSVAPSIFREQPAKHYYRCERCGCSEVRRGQGLS